MKRTGDLPEDWELTQCLFGEHLLNNHPEQPVAVVESEKTAFICSAFIPEFVWVATGGKSQLNQRMDVLKGREVVVFPDSDGYEEWCKKVEQFPYLDMRVSDIVHLNASAEERERQIDLADVILEERINL